MLELPDVRDVFGFIKYDERGLNARLIGMPDMELQCGSFRRFERSF